MGEGAALQIGAVHIYGGNLRVAVGGVVVDAAGGIAAGGINSDLILAGGHLTAAAHLLHAAKDVEELTEKVLHEARVFMTLSVSSSQLTEFMRVKAARTKRESEDRSPGRPLAPMPRL